MPKISSENFKVAIVGCGKVGMTAAYALLLKGVVDELVLLGRCKDEIIGEQLDLEHGLSFMNRAKVTATQDYADLANTDVVVITAGTSQKTGETRLDLTQKNLEIIREIIPKIVRYAPNSIILMVSNPVDLLTYEAYKLAGWPKGRIFGTGTTLDTARFRFHLSQFLQVSPKSIHAYVLGEHGDNSFPVISSASIGGQAIQTLPEFSLEKAKQAYEATKNAAYKIIASKGATYYAIATVIAHIVEAISHDAKSILPVSIPLHDYYGHYGIALSVPCVVGRQGVERILEAKLNWDEKQSLDKAVSTLKSYLG